LAEVGLVTADPVMAVTELFRTSTKTLELVFLLKQQVAVVVVELIVEIKVTQEELA
jgi:hypothetical protein